MSIAAKMIGGIGIGSFITSTAWVESRARTVPKENRGSIILRMGETLFAALQKRKMPAKHVDLISSLSSKKYATPHFPTHSPGYLFNVTPSEKGPFIFRYKKDFPSRFIFAGSSSKIHDQAAREEILKGRYTRCKIHLPSDVKMDVLLTGSSNCSSFRTRFMKDTLLSASQNTKKPFPPLPIFELPEGKLKPIGDLSALTDETKKAIAAGNFTLCTYYSHDDAIVLGIKNRKVCRQVLFELTSNSSKRWIK